MNRYLGLTIIGLIAGGGNLLGGYVIARQQMIRSNLLRWLTARSSPAKVRASLGSCRRTGST